MQHPNPEALGIAFRVRKWRKQCNLSQAEVAKRTGIARPNISRIEKGTHLISVTSLVKLAKVFGCRPGELLDNLPPSDLEPIKVLEI